VARKREAENEDAHARQRDLFQNETGRTS